MSWKLTEGLRARLGRERGALLKPPGGGRLRVAFCYPNTYRVGMSNLGLHILYALLNARGDVSCERVFLPEDAGAYVNSGTPLMSLETQTPLREFDVVAFAVSFELDYFHLLTMLTLGRVGLRGSERSGDRYSPLVIAGGPCATFNPEPLAEAIDAFVIGEGEIALPAMMDVLAAMRGESRARQLAALAGVNGVYVPSAQPSKVQRQWVRDLDEHEAHTHIVADDTEFSLYLLETARGCGRHCRFCMAGYCFRRPRTRSLSSLQRQIDAARPFGKRLGLMGAAISDYPQIDELCRYIIDSGLTMSVASLRADSVTPTLVNALAASGTHTLTLAPEAGSERLRGVINKGISEADVQRGVELGLSAGLRRFRLYAMVGLPTETESDVDELIAMSTRLMSTLRAHKAELTLSVNPFVPKPQTPFQWSPMADKATLTRRLRHLREGCRREGVQVLAEPVRSALAQGVLARGGRRVGEALLATGGDAHRFRAALESRGVDVDAELRGREVGAPLPWDALDMGLRDGYLAHELSRALAGSATPACAEGCRRCGVCS